MFLPNDPLYPGPLPPHHRDSAERAQDLHLRLARGAGEPDRSRREGAQDLSQTSSRCWSADPNPAAMSDDEFERKLFLCSQPDRGHGRKPGHQEPLHPQLLQPHRGLQGPASPPPTLEALLSRSARSELHHGDWRIFHQRYSDEHLPYLAAFAIVAHAESQRRNQYRGTATASGRAARESELQSPLFGDAITKLRPIIQPGGSDSSSLDNALGTPGHERTKHPPFHAHARSQPPGRATPGTCRRM